LIADRQDVVSGFSENFQAAPADILVELDLHPAPGTAMIRSRAASAP
jgi:hypothetical protein